MMQVNVKEKPMNQVSEEMDLIRKKINTCQSELVQIRRDLTILSGLEEPVRQIRWCETNLEQQARHCFLFGSVIRQICRQYFSTEDRIIDYGETVQRKALRESLSSRNLNDLYSLFYKVIVTRGGD